MRAKRNKFFKVQSRERGQTAMFVLLAMGLFLIGGAGFAVDLANLWMHHQAAQNAADAACTAAAMDMVNYANGGTSPGSTGFTPGTAFLCSASGNSTKSPCQYASFNGYAANGLTANTPSTEVSISFPTSVSGVKSCSGSPPPSVCTQTGFPTNAFVNATVTDRMQSFFLGMLAGKKTLDSGATATCGAVLSNAPIPILVLNPTASGSLSINGNITIQVVGGPQRSIQVDSSDPGAVSVNGKSNSIDLSHGGPFTPPATQGTGSDYGITGSEPLAMAGQVSFGTTGNYLSPSPSISDPFATISAPSTAPGYPVRPSDLTAAQCPSIPCHIFPSTVPNHGCQDASNGCWLYTAGLYDSTNTINTFKQVDLFDPGVYYLKSDLTAAAQTCLRPGTGVGDGSGGTMFYFSGANTLKVAANSGTYGVCGTSTPVPLSQLQCVQGSQAGAPGPTGITVLPANVVANGGLTGSVLLGPCSAPTAGGTNYGDPLTTCTAPGNCTTGDPLGVQRGMLFFQDRSATGVQASWGGGGTFGLMGFMYFHSSGSYSDLMTLQGNSSSTSFVIGDIVTDKLSLGGNPTVEMDLNPNALYYVLKASLLQ
jgi:Flp pilus assembly protein TadG